jgi:hypothetical protein
MNKLAKGVRNLLIAATASIALSGIASAAPLSTYLQNAGNVVEDDSNEYIFRLVGDTYQLVLAGPIQQGDVLVQILDFPIINGTNIDSASDELTGIAVQVVTSVSNPPTVEDPDGGGPIPPYNAVDLTFGAATTTQWSLLTGIDTTSLGFDSTGLVSLIYYDEANNLDVNTQGFPASIGTATDGTLTFALGLTGGGTFVSATNVPLDIATFLPSAGEVPGVTQYGTFNYLLNPLFENVNGVVSTVTGSGTNLVTDRPAIAAVIDDTQASFTITQVPEPATLALLGVALLGMAGVARGRKA